MPQDAYTLRRVAIGLDGCLKGGKINKIVQPSRDEVSLSIYTGKGTVKLVLNTNASDCGAYFGETADPPAVAPNFCMLLRKYLHGATLLSVSLVGFERVMRFSLLAETDFTSANRELLLEVMGKYSNLILTENGMILGALKTNSLDTAAKRTVFAGVKYVLPAKQDKADPSDPAALRAALAPIALSAEGNLDLGHALFTRLAGLAPVTAQYLADSFKGGDLPAHIERILFEEPDRPSVTERDFFAYPAEGGTPYPTLLEAESAFFLQKRRKKAFESERRTLQTVLSAAVKKAEKKLALLREKRLSCADLETDRKRGELLTAYLWKIGRGRSCTLTDYENGEDVTIPLDETLSPAENAQMYFKRYRKKKRTVEMTAPQEDETARELDYLQSVSALLASARDANDLLSLREELISASLLPNPDGSKPSKRNADKGKKPSSKSSSDDLDSLTGSLSSFKGRGQHGEIPVRVYEKEGFRILAGRNNLQNDRLVRSCSPDDIWMHAQRYHSCHVVIRTGGRDVPTSVLQFAADLCAKYSDGGGDRIPVDYCPLKFVKKPKGSKAGFVTYSSFRTLLGSPSSLS